MVSPDGVPEASTHLEEVREEWLRLLPRLTAEAWGTPIGPDGTTVGELFAELIADLELASSPLNQATRAGTAAATPRFALDFLRRRLASKISGRYSAGDIGAELERRYDKTIQALLTGNAPAPIEVEEILHRMHERLLSLRSVLER